MGLKCEFKCLQNYIALDYCASVQHYWYKHSYNVQAFIMMVLLGSMSTGTVPLGEGRKKVMLVAKIDFLS